MQNPAVIPIDKAEFDAFPPEKQQALVAGSRAQMILELIVAARIPLDILTLTALQIGMQRSAGALEVAADEGELTSPERPSEIYLASNLNQALKGGSHKVIFDGKK